MKNKKGFTLIEVLAALLIFSLVLGGIAPSMLAQLKKNTSMEVKTAAMSAAQQKLDEMRQQVVTSFPTSGTTGPEAMIVNGRQFQVYTSFCQEPSFCITPNNRHVSIEIQYKNAAVFTTETVFTTLN